MTWNTKRNHCDYPRQRRRALNVHELACLQDKEYMRLYAEILTGYKLNDKELNNMITAIKKQG